MLQQMRDWNRYLKWVLIVVVFMFVVWAFASWTGGGMGVRPEESAWAARVNGTPIDALAFQNYARQLDTTYQSIFGEQYAQQRGMIRVGRQAINQMVEEELLYQEASRQGLSIAPEEIVQAITRDPGLQENGRFIGVERYREIFRTNRTSLKQYESQMSRRLLIDKYRNLIGNGVVVADSEVQEEFLRRNQKSTVDYIVVDPVRLPPAPAAGEAELLRFYEEHKDRYLRGEGRTGRYVLLGPGDASTVEVPEAEVRAAYDRDLATRFTVKEQRRASHILFKIAPGASQKDIDRIEARAKGVLARARSGNDFGALAAANSEDSTASAGGDLNFFGRGQMVAEFEAAAFSVPVGSISDLVRTSFGFHIIKVTDAREPRTIPFEEASDRIRDEIRMGRARSQVLDRAAALAAAAEGGRLEAAAQAQGLAVLDTGPVRDGDALSGVPASQQVVARMMSLKPGEVSAAIAIPSGQVVVQVTGTVPDEPRPLAEIRARVEKELTDERHRQAVAALVRQSGGADGLKALARRFKTEVKTQADLSRGVPITGLPRDPAVERQVETLAVGQLGEPVVTASGVVVLSVRERADHRDLLEEQKDSTRDSLIQQQRDRLLRSVVRQLRDRGEVLINEPVIDAIDRT